MYDKNPKLYSRLGCNCRNVDLEAICSYGWCYILTCAGFRSVKKTYTEVVNADKVYIALQYGVVAAAKAYVASNSLTNKLLYNNSYVKAIQASNVELNLAIKSANCYSAKNIAGYKANVKTNTAQIASIISANVNGQLVGDPKKMTTFKPVGLLK